MLDRDPNLPRYERLRCDVAWEPARHIEIVPPARVSMLAEWGSDAAGPSALSPVAITSPFRFLSDEGVAVLQAVCAELEQHARSAPRIPKLVRGGTYRSAFLHGMNTDPALLAFLRGLACSPLEPHPVHHHAMHVNYAPDDLTLNVDEWHRDSVAFDYVLMVNDPRPMQGGELQYFVGAVEEGRQLLATGQPLPPDRVVSVEFPGPGWAVLQQGHRVLHRATRLRQRYPRVTLVNSYWSPVPGIQDAADPTDLQTMLALDHRQIALVEWGRLQALIAARRLEHLAAAQSDFHREHAALQADLRAIAAGLLDAAASFDAPEDQGRMIAYGKGD